MKSNGSISMLVENPTGAIHEKVTCAFRLVTVIVVKLHLVGSYDQYSGSNRSVGVVITRQILPLIQVCVFHPTLMATCHATFAIDLLGRPSVTSLKSLMSVSTTLILTTICSMNHSLRMTNQTWNVLDGKSSYHPKYWSVQDGRCKILVQIMVYYGAFRCSSMFTALLMVHYYSYCSACMSVYHADRRLDTRPGLSTTS